MAYLKFTSSNQARGELLAGITAVATTLILDTGQGGLFPTTYPYQLEIIQRNGVDPTIIDKREIVRVSLRSGDTFTISRGNEACPASSSATTQTTTAFAFNAGDEVSLAFTSDTFEDLQDEVTRLEDDKLNTAGQLRTGNGAWKVSHTDGSGNEVELALGTSGTVLTSNGASSAPTFNSPTVDINALTETTTLANNDYTVIYDESLATNRKHLVQSSETNEGMVERATDAESIARTDTTRFVTPAHLGLVSQTAVLTTSINIDTASSVVNIPHGLSTTPKWCSVSAILDIGTNTRPAHSHGFSNGTTNRCVYLGTNSAGDGIAGNQSAAIYIVKNSGGNTRSQSGVITFDSTNVIITYTRSGTATINQILSVTLMVHT